eukprot:COSAG05_NODE_1168_length_5629_cov_21.906691_2_plen_151_part_00
MCCCCCCCCCCCTTFDIFSRWGWRAFYSLSIYVCQLHPRQLHPPQTPSSPSHQATHTHIYSKPAFFSTLSANLTSGTIRRSSSPRASSPNSLITVSNSLVAPSATNPPLSICSVVATILPCSTAPNAPTAPDSSPGFQHVNRADYGTSYV